MESCQVHDFDHVFNNHLLHLVRMYWSVLHIPDAPMIEAIRIG